MNKAPITRGIDILFNIGDKTFELKATTCWIKQKIALSKSFDIGAVIREAPEGYYQFVDNLTGIYGWMNFPNRGVFI